MKLTDNEFVYLFFISCSDYDYDYSYIKEFWIMLVLLQFESHLSITLNKQNF